MSLLKRLSREAQTAGSETLIKLAQDYGSLVKQVETVLKEKQALEGQER